MSASCALRVARWSCVGAVVAVCFSCSPKTEEGASEGAPQPRAVGLVIAGNGEMGFRDGQGAKARMNKPIRLAALNRRSVVFADIDNHAIRTMTKGGEVRTIAGGPTLKGHLDGPGLRARFSSPHGVAVRADGVIAVAEAQGNTIRLLTPVEGSSPTLYTATTLCGTPGKSGFQDGPVADALFNAPHAVAWGGRGQLYVADIGNGRLRMIEKGSVSTVAGTSELGDRDGPLGQGTLKYPIDIALGDQGSVWIADGGNFLVRRWRAGVGLDTPFEGLGLQMPHGIAVQPKAVFIADLHQHEVIRIDSRTSAQTIVYGASGEGIGPGQLRKPAAVLIHGGMLWIADLGNHRILAIPYPGS